MQANELDSEFIQRLLSSEGINWLIDESQLKVSSSSEPIQPQKLRLIDDNAQYQSLERQNIRFSRSSTVESSDSITNLVGQRSIQPTSVHIQHWQANTLEVEEGAGSVQSKHSHSDNQDNASLGFSRRGISHLHGYKTLKVKMERPNQAMVRLKSLIKI